MTFLLTQGKKAVRTVNLAERYKKAKVTNKLVQHGMGKQFAQVYCKEFTNLPEQVQVVKS